MAWLTVRGTRAWDWFSPFKGNIPMAVKGRAAIYGSRNPGSFAALSIPNPVVKVVV